MSDQETRELLVWAMTAWNLSFLPEAEHADQYKELAEKGISGEQETILREMVRRKKQLFPDNKRIILDYDFTPNGDTFSLDVISTVTGPP